MVEGDDAATVGDSGWRLGANSSLVANYHTKLLAEGLIEPAGHGGVDFAVPGLRWACVPNRELLRRSRERKYGVLLFARLVVVPWTFPAAADRLPAPGSPWPARKVMSAFS